MKPLQIAHKLLAILKLRNANKLLALLRVSMMILSFLYRGVITVL